MYCMNELIENHLRPNIPHKKRHEQNKPENIIFTDKELNAMFNALDKNRTKYDALLKRFNVQNIYVDSLEARHKLDIKQKLDKINELDEQIEFMSIKKGEYNTLEILYYNLI